MAEEFLEKNQNKNQKGDTLKQDNSGLVGGTQIFILKNSDIGALLLHSYTSTPYEMKELANYLAERNITVYAPMIAGHGTTPEDLAKTKISDWQASVENAYYLLKQHTKKIFVIGSSFGGNLAFHLADKFNNPLAGVVSMGTPIKVYWQNFFKLGLYTYGLFKKNQKKRRRDYRLTLIESDQVVYPVMPVKSLRQFFAFIKKITIPSLSRIKAPTLIIQSSHERIVNPNSAQFIHQNLGSPDKRILWMNGSTHTLAIDEKRELIFNSIYHFISEKSKN